MLCVSVGTALLTLDINILVSPGAAQAQTSKDNIMTIIAGILIGPPPILLNPSYEIK
jgi:hypothetical protein